MNREIFREYDIRGKVGEDFVAADFQNIALTYGTMIREGGGRRVALGHDVRATSPALSAAFSRGLIQAGIDVEFLGEVPTPVVYFAVHHLELDGGVQITGSHNPVAYNGIKMMRGTGSFYGDDIRALAERLGHETPAGTAGQSTSRGIKPEYRRAITDRVRLDRPLTVVVDAGNGCAWELAPQILRDVGCTVHELFCEPDGRFPNHIADPTLPETLVTLRETVLATGADLGLAFDGDADRLGALDARGQIIWGDQLLALFARDVLVQHPGAAILFEVKCSRGLIEDIQAHGGRPVMTRTGHSIIKEAMKAERSPLAGEMSGHLFFADDWYGFDDGIFAASRLVALIANGGRSLADLAESLPVYHATPELRIECPDDQKFRIVSAVQEHFRGRYPVSDIDGARVDFDAGWGLIRASNTQPVLVLRAEGRTEADRDRSLEILYSVLRDLGLTDLP